MVKTEKTTTAFGHYLDSVDLILMGGINVGLYRIEGRECNKDLVGMVTVGGI